MPSPSSDHRRWLRAANRGVWAAMRPVVRDSRGKTVPVFDSRVRLWRDPPGLDFPQQEFRRVVQRLRPTRVRINEPSPEWSLAAGIAGGAVIGLSGVFFGLAPIVVVLAIVAWIVIWYAGLGPWISFAQAYRRSVNDPQAPVAASPHLVAGYARIPGMLLVPGIWVLLMRLSPPIVPAHWRTPVIVLIVLYLLWILYYAVTLARKRARTFPRAANELQVARALLAEHRCPTCAYDLRSVDREGDGCTVCPECGGAWRADEVGPVFAGM